MASWMRSDLTAALMGPRLRRRLQVEMRPRLCQTRPHAKGSKVEKVYTIMPPGPNQFVLEKHGKSPNAFEQWPPGRL